MSMNELETAIDNAGLSNAFKVVDLEKFYEFLEKQGLDEAVSNGCFQKFLQGLVTAGTFPASWQKLSDLGWADDEVSCMVDRMISLRLPWVYPKGNKILSPAFTKIEKYFSLSYFSSPVYNSHARTFR